MPMGDEVLHKQRHASCQTDWSQERACAPDGNECLLHRRAMRRRPIPAHMLCKTSDQDALSQEGTLSFLVQDSGRISPGVPRGFTEIIQHC
jgi:hypothetical protein